MPEICRFYGIIIKMFFDDHSPPHFHAEYGEFKARLEIKSAKLLSGKLPAKPLSLVRAWAIIHEKNYLRILKT